MVNLTGVLLRVFNRIPKQDALAIIEEKTGWVPEKKLKKKEDIKDKFLELERIIKEEEIEDFVQMAVMRKSIGLPAYTYKVTNLTFLDGFSQEKIIENFTVDEHTFKDVYIISTKTERMGESLEFHFRLKEFESQWLTGVNNLTSLSAVFTANVTLNTSNRVLTVYTGNHQVQDVLIAFMSSIFKMPIISYSLKDFHNQINELGSVSFKTALLLDFVSHRLKQKGIEATFKEIKFYTGSKNKKDGIKDVAIGGKALLSSQLACEYITIGSDIVFFSTDMIYNGVEFSTKVYLKGSKLDILKIVILDTDDEDIKSEVIEIIQSEYIDMCNNGIKDIAQTKVLLNTIANKYLNKDQLIIRVIEENTLRSISIVTNLLSFLNDQDEDLNNSMREFIQSNRTVLDSIGYNNADLDLKSLNAFVGDESPNILDEEDYSADEEGGE
ncbi:hypothetical protein [Paenibacillus amylolyticus]|uniref:hypothetical protein n=1 Tax=Paenibacillus amylolyticus TaxID=1451 RepID=UPI003D9947A3